MLTLLRQNVGYIGLASLGLLNRKIYPGFFGKWAGKKNFFRP